MNADNNMREKTEAELADAAHRNARHYRHAWTKHPQFADSFVNGNNTCWHNELTFRRRAMKESIAIGQCETDLILACEIAEIYEAYTRRDLKQTRAEIRDAIAVLERMDDWIETEQRAQENDNGTHQ